MSWFAVAWSGFVAVILSIAFLSAFHALHLTQFSPTIQLGCLVVKNPRHPAAETTGFVMLLLLGSTILPAVYARFMEVAGGPSWQWGLGIGVVHGLLAAAFLPVFGTISACIRAGAIPAPGPMGTRWGWLTPVALAAGHGLYGAVCGAILGNL